MPISLTPDDDNDDDDDDTATEILTRLPAKEIVRLRCVSKQWLSFTSNPSFTRLHSARNPHPPISGFFLSSRNPHRTQFFPLDGHPPSLPDPSLSFIPTAADAAGGNVHVTSHCNGLIICYEKTQYYICNPTTKQFLQLPPLPKGITSHCFNLAFDPSKSPHYKVVSIAAGGGGGSQIHIYSSETRSWRQSVASEFGGVRFDRSVYWNGALVWVGMDGLLCFDVDGERMKKLPMPPCEPRGVWYVGESGGKLQMIAVRAEEFDVLEMESSDGSGWLVRYHVELDRMKDLYPDVRTSPMQYWGCILRSRMSTNRRPMLRFSPVCFIRGGGGGMLLLGIPGKIISYDLETKKFEEVCGVPGSGAYESSCYWHGFYALGHTLFSL